jgi:lipoprotein-anchoring transpeptidase ErfK/SrfK
MTSRRSLVAVALAAAVLGAGVAALLTHGDGSSPAGRAAPPLRTAAPPPLPPKPAGPVVPAGPLAARVLRRVQLRARPGGAVVRSVDTTTGYGSPRVLAVIARRGRWLGVLSDHVANSRAAWIPASAAELVHEPYRLDVDISARRLTVRRDGRVVRRIGVAVGKQGTTTPIGRFAVTDTLRISRGYPQYGCCALALTARQPDVPQGWSGGDRIAIHGTSAEGSIGSAASNGCLRARNADMRWLIRTVTLGAAVRIRA